MLLGEKIENYKYLLVSDCPIYNFIEFYYLVERENFR